MGEGIARSLDTGQGLGRQAVHGAAEMWGKLVDRIPRRAAFLHEAHLRGYRSRADIEGCSTTRRSRTRLLEITRVANDEIIDYGNLSSFERNIARRVIFFYPWVKGATLYGARAVGEYPVKLAVIAQLAKETAEKQRADLGPVPSYAESLMRVGGTDDRPNVINPASAGILGQTYSTLGQVASLAGGDFGAANEPWNALTPGWGWGSTCCGVRPVHREGPRPWRLAHLARTGRRRLAQVRLYERLTQDQSDRLYPMSDRQAILDFLFGGLAERPVNRSRLNQQAREGR